MLKGILRIVEPHHVGFKCPGCKEVHVISIQPPHPCWSFNGDYEKPSFTPSILVTGCKVIRDEHGEWTGDWERDANGKALPSVCHSFITDGKIQFLNDCTHELAGQTVPLGPSTERIDG
ncbi:MAG: DUF6527 family protein [Rhodoferax sp.]|nr:DUF6527 family protein [Rhodoferax sp.]